MTNTSKVAPKPWQLIAFIFARPIVFIVIAMTILGGLFAVIELYKVATMLLMSK
mgnify:CR=1 FL=1